MKYIFAFSLLLSVVAVHACSESPRELLKLMKTQKTYKNRTAGDHKKSHKQWIFEYIMNIKEYLS